MSVANPLYNQSYVGRGDTGPYAITFSVTLDAGGNAEDILVQVRSSTGAVTDITATSTITGMNVYTAASWAAANTIVLTRYPSLIQPYSFPFGTKFPSRTFEAAVDRLLFSIHRIAGDSDTAIKIPIGEAAPSRLPDAPTRASKFMSFDGSGQPNVATGLASAPVSGAMAGFVNAASLGVAQGIITPIQNITTGAGDSTQNPPLASSVLGSIYTYNKVDSGAGKVKIIRQGSDLISGQTEIDLFDQWDSASIMAVSANTWVLIAKPLVSQARLESENKLPLGALQYIDGQKITPVAWSFLNPAAHQPWLCLDVADQVITTTNWPLLVPYLRGLLLSYADGTGSQVTTFTTTTWQVTGTTTGILTFTNNAANVALLTSLLEDEAVEGTYTNWRTIFLASSIGNIPAGNFFITNVNPGALTISFTIPVSTNGGPTALGASCQFYKHRLADSESNPTTSARVLQAAGRGIASANDSNNETILGLRRRDREQGHWHLTGTGSGGSYGLFQSGYGNSLAGTPTNSPTTDTANGTPRTGLTTHQSDIIAHLYMNGQRYA